MDLMISVRTPVLKYCTTDICEAPDTLLLRQLVKLIGLHGCKNRHRNFISVRCAYVYTLQNSVTYRCQGKCPPPLSPISNTRNRSIRYAVGLYHYISDMLCILPSMEIRVSFPRQVARWVKWVALALPLVRRATVKRNCQEKETSNEK